VRLLSAVIPLFNEEANVAELLRRVQGVLEVLPGIDDFEIICVNDGSGDGTLAALRAQLGNYPKLVIVSLSRNFGHQLAATAGLDTARGDAVVLMDGDLQDPPELIAPFVEKWREGYDVVYAVRRTRKGEQIQSLYGAGVLPHQPPAHRRVDPRGYG
jgi:polyisoprenyl-phosphate glycosyltransferase